MEITSLNVEINLFSFLKTKIRNIRLFLGRIFDRKEIPTTETFDELEQTRDDYKNGRLARFSNMDQALTWLNDLN